MKNLNYQFIGILILLAGFLLVTIGVVTGDFTGYPSTTGIFSKISMVIASTGIVIAVTSAIIESIIDKIKNDK